MERIILGAFSKPVYGFLSFINERHPKDEKLKRGKILECGAGGSIPPLALFAQHGYEAWGIDISDEQLNLARQFCEQHGIRMQLRTGDMRQIPFEDEAFDYVYEHYALCHLSKKDTAQSLREMYRVLKHQGLCFLGVMSVECWPESRFGHEKGAGEYWGEEGGEGGLHSLFSDEEIEDLLSDWEIVFKEKHISYLWGAGEKLSKEAWKDAYSKAGSGYSQEAWRARYKSRANEFQYAHLYYFLKKL